MPTVTLKLRPECKVDSVPVRITGRNGRERFNRPVRFYRDATFPYELSEAELAALLVILNTERRVERADVFLRDVAYVERVSI